MLNEVFSSLAEGSFLFPLCYRFPGSGDEGIRTPDPLLARQVLSQLSYTPIFYMVMFFHQLLSSLCSLRSLMCLRLDSNFALARSHQVLWLWA